jgi:hypothetical protein
MVCPSVAEIEPEEIEGEDLVKITWELLEN